MELARSWQNGAWVNTLSCKGSGDLDYRSSGVDTDLGDWFVKGISRRVSRTKQPGVIEGIGGFAGLFEMPEGLQDPVLVAGTDGVGTKLLVAKACNRHETVGIDLVAMCVNDVLTVGARPLFFLDYIATGRLDPDQMLQVVDGVMMGCEQASCALLGGETAEMPGMYQDTDYDLAGFCLGVVEKHRILSRSQVQVGDLALALPSSGIHSNGYSLVRRIVAERGWEWSQTPSGWDRSLAEEALTPTRIYVPEVLAALEARIPIRSIAHITGGGLPGNLPRVLGEGQSVRLYAFSWPIPKVFPWLQQQGKLSTPEMFRTFNLGVGLVMMIDRSAQELAQQILPEAMVIGEVVPGEGTVVGIENWGLYLY